MRTRVRLRPVEPRDLAFLRAMLYEAAAWNVQPDDRSPIDDVLGRPRTALYLEGWGRFGDAGVVAEIAGAPAGAAWYRFFDPASAGYGFVDPSIPELTIGVRPDARGRGIGRLLVDGLLDVARNRGVAAVSLSVEEDNAALRLYERCGFRRAHLVDGAWTMVADLSRVSGGRRDEGGPGSPSA